MRKLWNSVIAMMLIITCSVTCFAQLANNLFQEDLGRVVMGEVNLDGQIENLFGILEINVPQENMEQFENLKDEIKNNTEIQGIISVASRDMLDDIVDTQSENQDFKKVISDMIYSYDDELTEILDGQVSNEELHKAVDGALEVLPVQIVYDTAVESFQETIPESYLKIMKLVSVFSKPSTFYLFIGLSVVLTALLVILNLRYLRWTFSIGVVGIVSGGILLVMGQIAPIVFGKLLDNLSRALTQLSNTDFHIITMYGLSYLFIGGVSLLLYFMFARKKALD